MKSFATRIRDTLSREEIQREKPCCRLGELTGFAFSCGTVTLMGGGGRRVTLRTEHAGVARRMARLLRDRLNMTPSMRIKTASRLGGRQTFELRLEGEDAMAFMRQSGLTPLTRDIPRHCLLKKCCRRAFMRGVFLGCGTVADPQKGYHLEMVLSDGAIASGIAKLLQAFYGIRAGVTDRKGAHVVYIKEGEGIQTALSLIGAHGAILEMENVRILRDARNRANRASNCDAANITKMLDASSRHLGAIRRIEETIGLSALPEALHQMALERKAHPDASLEELGAQMEPPMGKSGVNHRLRRLEAIAENLITRSDQSIMNEEGKP